MINTNVSKRAWSKITAIMLCILMIFTFIPTNIFAVDFNDGTKASVGYGRTLKDSSGNTYHMDDASFVARFSNASGNGFAYRLASSRNDAKRTYTISKGGREYPAYCIEHGAWLESGNTTYEAAGGNMSAVKFMKPYSDEERKAIMLALYYGRQPEMGNSDVPVLNCNLDDWYMATQMIIWEVQQGLRSTKNGNVNLTLSGTHSVTYSCPYAGSTATRTQPANFYSKNIAGRDGYKAYKWMLEQMYKHGLVPRGMFYNENKAQKGKPIKLEKQADGTYSTVVDGGKCDQDIKLKGKNPDISITRVGNKYTITSTKALPSETVYEGKKITKAVEPKDDMMIWTTGQKSSVGDSNHLQCIVSGAKDPISVFLKLTTSDVPEEKTDLLLPNFNLDLIKLDENPGFDGNHGTGMGDAALDAGITVEVTTDKDATGTSNEYYLDAYGKLEGGPVVITPWTEAGDLTKSVRTWTDKEEPFASHTETTYQGTATVVTSETSVPAGRFTEAESQTGNGSRSHTLSFSATKVDDAPFSYSVTADGTSYNDLSVNLDMATDTYVNDNFRGKLQIVKTIDDLDPFTDEEGVKTYSDKSKWTVELTSGGYEGNPYIRVVKVNKGEAGYSDFANTYRATRDTSGTYADKTNPLEVNDKGQINILDLPYGTYLVKEITADTFGYVLESFEITVTTDGQIISKDVNNVPKMNLIKVTKTNIETGKTVALSGTAFRIKYLGNPDSKNPENDKHYGKYLPNGSDYKDGKKYIFEVNENGFLVLPYQLEYGNYQLEELTVPDGYFVGQYDKNGIGTSVDMNKTFDQVVTIYDGNGNKVTDFTNNKKIIFNTYKFAVTEQTDHKDGEDYKIFYVNIDMANNPVKGKIEITKMGESLAGWLNGNNGATAVWDNAKLKDATFKVYAAEDIRQVDGVTRIKAFDSKDNKEIALEEVTRDHAQVTGAKSFWQSLIKTGEKILRFIGLDISLGNKAETEYLATETKGASYTETFSKKKGNLTYTYTVDYSLEYAKGGFNYTNIHVIKNTVADDYVANIDTTKPVLVCGNEEIDINNVNLYNKNMVKLNGEITDEYGKTDVTAKVISKTVKVIPVDGAVAPEAPEGFIIDDTNKKMYLASKTVNQGKEDETKNYQVYVNENGTNRWVDCDANGNFSDEPVPQEGYTKMDKSDTYMASSADAKYQIYVTDGGTKKWVDCDANGNFYKSYNQNYNFTTVQHFNTAEGFSFKFDELALASQTDNAKEIATTVVTGFKGITPAIGINGAYTSTTEGDITTFVATPDTIAPVYFMTADGIKSSMILTGGIEITTIELTQSQLAKYKSEYPVIEYNGNLIDWGKDLNPDNNYFEYVIDDSNYCKAERHEKSPTVKEVYYTLTIATNSKDAKTGFKVTYPDTTQLIPTLGTYEGKEVGKLLFTSTEATMVYPIGNPVATITTNEKGIATTPNLPLGKYYIQEISSTNGHVNKGEWREFNLTYKDQYTPLIWDKAQYGNEAVNVKIDLTKLLETGYKSKDYAPGSGAVFGVYSAEKISAVVETKKHINKKSIEANTLVGTLVSGADGKAVETLKLPLGKYYVKEISAPSGYVINTTKYYFNAIDILDSDAFDFNYTDIGVIGSVTQDGDETVVQLQTLYRFPQATMTVDGTKYDLSKSSSDGVITNTVMDGRTETKIRIKNRETAITFETGHSLTIKSTGETYTAIFDNGVPTLELGKGDNLIKTTDGTKTVVSYSPKATTTVFNGEAILKYVKPLKAEADMTPEELAKTTVLAVKSPMETSMVTTTVKYDYSQLTATLDGTVTSMELDGEVIPIATTVNVGKGHMATVNFDDGVTFTIAIDKKGDVRVTTAGEITGNTDKETTLTVDGKTELPETVTLKNVTAKTYARNNTNAGRIDIKILGVKNDATPTVPNVPVTPTVPDAPIIRTTATDGDDSDHIVKADKKAIIVDTVTYTNLIPEKEYTLKGILMDKATGQPLLVDGKEVTATKTFIPKTKDGSVDISFVFNAAELDGKTTVVFERLYQDGKEIAVHTDINDLGQTVSLKLKIGEIDLKPNIKPTIDDDGKVDLTPDTPKTGDTSQLWLYAIMLLIAMFGLTTTLILNKKRKN